MTMGNGATGNGLAVARGQAAMASANAYATAALTKRCLDKEELAAWILEKGDPALRNYQCGLFALVYLGTSGKDVITPIIFPKKMSEGERKIATERACKEFDQASRRYADMFPAGNSGFMIAGHISDNPEESAHCQYPFVVAPSPELASAFERNADEGPNLTGVVGNLQRLLDTTLKSIVNGAQSDKDRYLAEIEENHRHLEKLSDQNFAKAQMIEKLLNEQADREIRVQQARMDIEFDHKLKMGLLSFGKGFIEKQMEAKYGASESNPFFELLKTAEPQQIVAIMATLTPEQKDAMLPVIGHLLEKMEPQKREKLQGLLMVRAQQEAAEIAERAKNPDIKVVVVKEESK